MSKIKLGHSIDYNTIQSDLNKTIYYDYFDRLSLLAKSMFTWVGLDEIGGNSRFLEDSLFNFGRAVFIKDDMLGFMSLRATPAGSLNNYLLPTKVMAHSVNYNKIYDLDNCVYILNNEMQLPTAKTIAIFAYKLTECELAIISNVNAQKTPILIEGDFKQTQTLKNLYMQYSGGVPVIFGNKWQNLQNSLNVLKTDAPFIADKLCDYKHDVINDFLTFLGVNSSNTDKRERLITDEVDANNDLVSLYLNAFLKTRQKACEEINKKYGLNLSIEVNKEAVKEFLNELYPILDNEETQEPKEETQESEATK